MAVRTKTRRRLKFVAIALIAMVVTGAAAYAIRKQQIAARILAGREEGYVALEEGDYFNALHKIGPYLQRNRTDTEALFKYATARQRVPEPNARHISDALGLYRQLLDLDPNHEAGARALLDLYVRHGLNTEVLEFTESRTDLHAQAARITALTRLRRFNEAMPLALKYTAADPLNLQQQVLVLELMRQGGSSPQELIARVQTLREAHPDEPRFDLLLSIAHAANDDREKALTYARQAAEQRVDDAEFVQALVAQLDRLGRFDESRTVLERAAALPDRQQFILDANRRLLNAGQAQLVVERLANVKPSEASADTSLLALRALALIRLDRRAEAVEILTALQERKTDPLAPHWAEVIDAVYPADPTQRSEMLIILTCKNAIQQQPEEPYFYYHLGEAYARAGDEVAATQAMVAAHELSRAWGAPLAALSRGLLNMNRPQEALAFARAAHERAPQDVTVLNSMVAALIRSSPAADSPQIREARAVLDQVAQLSPADEDCRLLRVALYLHLDNKAEASRALDQCLSADPPLSAGNLLELARMSQAAGLDLHEQCYELSEKLHGVTSGLAFSRAHDAWRSGDAESGLKIMEEARQAARDRDSRAWRLAWARYLEAIEDPRAAQEWAAVQTAFPDDPVVQQWVLASPSVQSNRQLTRRAVDRLAEIIGEDGIAWKVAEAQWLLAGESNEADLVKATVQLNDVSRRVPDHALARRLLGECFVRLGRIDDAIEQFRFAARLEPQSNQVLLRLARLLHGKGDFSAADTLTAQIERNLDLPGRDPAAVRDETRALATLLAERGDGEHAIRLLERRATSADPGTADVQLAALYVRSGRMTEAFAERLLNNPDPAAVAIVAEFYASRGDESEAERLLKRLDEMELQPGVAELVRGRFYQRHGDAVQAAALFAAATEAAPADPRVWRALIAHHVAAGNADAALDAARRAQHAVPADRGFARLVRNADLIKPLMGYEPARAMALTLLDPSEDDAVIVEVLSVMAAADRDGASVGEVLPKLRPLADRAPRVLALQQLVAGLCLATGQPQDALNISTRSMQLFPNEPDPARTAAQALAMLGRWREALPVAEQWKQRLGRATIEVDAFLAAANLALGNSAAALAVLEPHLPAARENPLEQAEILRLYLSAAVTTGQTAAAAQTVEPLLDRSPPLRAAWMQLAGTTIADHAEAADWLQRVEPHLDQSSIAERMILAQAWVLLSQRSGLPAHASSASLALERASRDLQTASTSTAEEWQAVGMLYDAAGKPDAAEAGYRSALKLKPDLPVAQNNLAMLIVKHGGDLNEAMDLATKAAAQRDHPLRASFLDTLASVQGKAGQHDAAETTLRDAIRLDPGNALWQVHLVQTLVDAGKRDAARQALREVDSHGAELVTLTPAARQQLDALREQLR